MGLITAPRICGLNLPHTSEFTLKDPRGRPCALCMDDSIVHRSVMWIVHVLCTWTTPLVQTVSLNIWLRLMDEPYGRARDIDFYYPISCPLTQWSSKDIIWDLMHTFVVLPKLNLNYYICLYILFLLFIIIIIILVWATCHNLVGWPVATIVFSNRIPMCLSLNGWCRFVGPLSGPYI